MLVGLKRVYVQCSSGKPQEKLAELILDNSWVQQDIKIKPV